MSPSARRYSIRLRQIADPRDASLTSAYRLLSKTFPPSERVDKRDSVGSLRENAEQVLSDLAWHLIIAEDADGTVLGLVSGTYRGSVNVGVIGYLAIAAEKRAGGLGSRLRAQLRHACVIAIVPRRSLCTTNRWVDSASGCR